MKIMSWIFITRSHMNTAADVSMASTVVTFIQTTNVARTTVTGVHGICLFSFTIRRLAKVASATSWANGMLYATFQDRRCGFITESHVHMSTPSHGRLRINGSEPKMTIINTMSRIPMAGACEGQAEALVRSCSMSASMKYLVA